MKTAALELLAVVAVGLSGRACAYTLYVTSCDVTDGGTHEEEISFSFCQGGKYCNSEDTVEELPAGTLIDTDGSTIEIPVSLGFLPTTIDFSFQGDGDAWCIAAVNWEDGENLLGDDGAIWMENQTGELGCVDGHFFSDETTPCQSTWRFFNIDGSSDESYDFRVKACSGTSSSVALVYFCSTGDCDGTSGEEVSTTFEMTNVDGGWSEQQISLDFNPVAVRLEYVDDTWCAEQLTFNAFSLSGGTNTTDSTIFRNVQYNGDHRFQDTSDDFSWQEFTWAVASAVVAGVIVSTIVGICGFRRGRQNRRAAIAQGNRGGGGAASPNGSPRGNRGGGGGASPNGSPRGNLGGGGGEQPQDNPGEEGAGRVQDNPVEQDAGPVGM